MSQYHFLMVPFDQVHKQKQTSQASGGAVGELQNIPRHFDTMMAVLSVKDFIVEFVSRDEETNLPYHHHE